MNIFSIGISGIIFIISVVFTALLLMAILRNLKTGRRYRQNLSAKISNLRLSRMLALHRIDQDSYLHSQSVVDIENQMKRCSNCARTDHCDNVLEAAAEDQTAFCDNDHELQAIKRELGKAA